MISIISICYNNLEGLKKTLEIFNNHSFGNEIEIVIVDGGSTDGTKAYLKNKLYLQTLFQNQIKAFIMP
jgi:glycosyltransferase involved in cell wall biosynthesis